MRDVVPRITLSSLMNIEVSELSEQKAMELAGNIVDIAGDEQSLQGLDYAENLLNRITASGVSDYHKCRAHYFRANIWSARYHISEGSQEWLWKSETFDQELLELRKAVGHDAFPELPSLERAQIYTNLGNALNHIGRFIEAIEYWDRAIVAVPKFAMAYGNRGIGFGYYAGTHYDPGHEGVLMLTAFASLSEACAEDAIFDSVYQNKAAEDFSKKMNAIWSHYDIPHISENTDFENHSMGRGKKERAYRQWCLENRLFLNSLNDIAPSPIAAQDILTLPSLTVHIDNGPNMPIVINYFNLIKQEFCSARYALYEGIIYENVHFSDRKVLLYNTLDYPAHGFAIERIKMAFRVAYAVFDKLAFLLNIYLNLKHPERHVNFRNVWLTKNGDLHPALNDLKNWPMRGLFWLSKDIFESSFRESTEPDSKDLYELRNHLEHKFVSVHDSFFRTISPNLMDMPKTGIFDISVDDLIAKTLRQLKLARSAIIYLSLAIHVEEKRRADNRDSGKITAPMLLDTWDDQWKRRN